jgi:hypothetical protein
VGFREAARFLAGVVLAEAVWGPVKRSRRDRVKTMAVECLLTAVIMTWLSQAARQQQQARSTEGS